MQLLCQSPSHGKMATTKRPRRQLKERTHRLLFNGLPLILPCEVYEVEVIYGTIEDTNSSGKFEQKKLTFICDRVASVVEKANNLRLNVEGNCVYQYHETRFLSRCDRFMVKNSLPTLNEDERLTLVVKIHPNGIYYRALVTRRRVGFGCRPSTSNQQADYSSSFFMTLIAIAMN